MARITINGFREGRLRIYSGNQPPYYVEIPFETGDGQFPSGRARPDEEVIPTVGGFVFQISSQGESQLYQGQPISFGLWINYQDFSSIRGALSGLNLTNVGQPWLVGSHTWTPVSQVGSVIMPDLSYRSTQPFFDQFKKKVSVEVLWQSAHTAMRGSAIGFRYGEVYFYPQAIQTVESSDYVEMRAQGQVFGNIEEIWNFTTGISSII